MGPLAEERGSYSVVMSGRGKGIPRVRNLIPICVGDESQEPFQHALQYALRHRDQIVAEVAGMVQRWLESAGRRIVETRKDRSAEEVWPWATVQVPNDAEVDERIDNWWAIQRVDGGSIKGGWCDDAP